MDYQRGALGHARVAAFALAVAVIVPALSGCESDVDKLQRLELEATIACLAADARERVAGGDYPNSTAEDRARRLREAQDQRAECTLAERRLSRFLD